MSSEISSPAATTKTPARTTTAIGHRNRTSDKNRGATRCRWGDPGQRKIPDSLFRIWEEERRKPLRIGTRNLRSVLPELWAGQVKLHSKSLNNSTGRLLNTHYSSINRSRKDDKPPSQLRSRKQARAKNTVWRRNEQRKWRERMKEEEGIKPRKN